MYTDEEVHPFQAQDIGWAFWICVVFKWTNSSDSKRKEDKQGVHLQQKLVLFAGITVPITEICSTGKSEKLTEIYPGPVIVSKF